MNGESGGGGNFEWIEKVWLGRESVFDFIKRSSISTDGVLSDVYLELPGELPPRRPDEWHRKAVVQAAVTQVESSLKSLLDSPTDESIQDFCSVLAMNSGLSHRNSDLLEDAESRGIPVGLANELFKGLLRFCPNAEALKLVICALGKLPAQGDDAELWELLRVFGLHDSYIIEVSLALEARYEDPQPYAFELGQKLDDWGRIYMVDLLEGVQDPETQRWLLLEGYKNNVEWEYSTYQCAEYGRMIDALREESPSEQVLRASGEILAAMTHNGPTRNIHDYADAPEAIALWLSHIKNTMLDRSALYALVELDRLFDQLQRGKEDFDSSSLRRLTINEIEHYRLTCSTLLRCAEQETYIREALKNRESQDFYWAIHAARMIELDVWKQLYSYVRAGRISIEHLLPVSDPLRLAQAVKLSRIILQELDAMPKSSRWKDGRFHYGFHELQVMFSLAGECNRVSLPLYMDALSSPHGIVRLLAVQSLGTFTDQSISILVARKLKQLALTDPDVEVQLAAQEFRKKHD